MKYEVMKSYMVPNSSCHIPQKTP